MDVTPISILAIIISLLVIIVVLGNLISIKSSAKFLRPLARSINGELQIELFNSYHSIRVKREVLESRISIQPPASDFSVPFFGYSPPFLILKSSLPVSYKFMVAKKGLKGRFWESVSGKGIQTGDPFFDERFHVFTKEPEKVARLLQEEKRRHAIASLFSKGFISIEAKGEVIIIKKPYRCIRETLSQVAGYFLRNPVYTRRFQGVLEDDLNKDFILFALDSIERIVL